MGNSIQIFQFDHYNLKDGEDLTPAPARKRNKEIIAYALEQLKPLQAEAQKKGIKADFDLESLPCFLLMLTHKCKLFSFKLREVSPESIKWLTKDSWDELSYNITPDDYRYIVMGGIYWGETLIRNSDFLYWDLGKERTREKNFPWVYGAKVQQYIVDFNPITIFRNISMHILEKKDTDDRLRKSCLDWNMRMLNNPDYSKKVERLKRLF